jgi:hypothetical protein
MDRSEATFKKYSSTGVDWAAALMVSGDDGVNWFGRGELDGYSAWVIERNDGGAWGVGPLLIQ